MLKNIDAKNDPQEQKAVTCKFNEDILSNSFLCTVRNFIRLVDCIGSTVVILEGLFIFMDCEGSLFM